MHLSVRGFTFIELCIAISFVGVLSALALPNYKILTARAYDLSALSDYRQLKTVISAEELATEGLQDFNIRRRRGTVNLPSPLNRATLSEGVILDYVTKRTLGDTTIVTMQISHPSGRLVYRYTEINGQISEQIIRQQDNG